MTTGIVSKISDAITQPLKRFLGDPVKRVVKSMWSRSQQIRPYLKRKTIEGVTFDFWIGDKEARDWYDLRSTDPVWLEMRFLRDNLIHEGDVVLECGGHHGCTAILLSHWVGPQGKVITFEPSPRNGDMIEKNIQQNRLQNVRLERKAVGAARGKVAMYETSNSSVDISGRGTQVELTCLDDYAHLRPTVVKIDVEGFEMQVLQGARSILSTYPKLAIEIHAEVLPAFGASVESILELIDMEKYKLWIQWDDTQEPEEYDLQRPILKRCHLFCIPVVVPRSNS